jgi:hypothetical protein
MSTKCPLDRRGSSHRRADQVQTDAQKVLFALVRFPYFLKQRFLEMKKKDNYRRPVRLEKIMSVIILGLFIAWATIASLATAGLWFTSGLLTFLQLAVVFIAAENARGLYNLYRQYRAPLN